MYTYVIPCFIVHRFYCICYDVFYCMFHCMCYYGFVTSVLLFVLLFHSVLFVIVDFVGCELLCVCVVYSSVHFVVSVVLCVLSLMHGFYCVFCCV